MRILLNLFGRFIPGVVLLGVGVGVELGKLREVVQVQVGHGVRWVQVVGGPQLVDASK